MRRYHFAVFTLALCLTTAAVLADTTTFTVDSYIPDQYRDLRWLVDGSLNLTGEDNDREEPNVGVYALNTRHSDGSQQRLSLLSSAGYRFYSIPRFLNLNLDLRLSSDWRSNTSVETGTYRPTSNPGTARIENSSDYSRQEYRIMGNATAGQYLVDDLYFTPGISVYAYQWDNPTDHDIYVRNEVDTVANRVVDERVWQDGNRPDISRSRELQLTAGIGYGRVYDGQFAAHALEIIQQLDQYGLLIRQPSYTEVEGLTQIVYFRRQESPIDERYQRIEILREMADHLVQSGVIDETALAAVPLLQDVWDYYDRSQRRFGWQVEGGVSLAYRDETSDATNRYDYYNRRFENTVGDPAIDTVYNLNGTSHRHEYYRMQQRGVYADLQARFYRPLALRWQFDFEAGLRYALLVGEDITERSVDFQAPIVQLSHYEDDVSQWQEWWLAPTVRYIYDRRTTVSLTGLVAYQQNPHPFRLLPRTRPNRNGNYYQLAVSGEYRISVPTSINARVIGDYWAVTYDGGPEIYEWGYRIDLSVRHYLF